MPVLLAYMFRRICSHSADNLGGVRSRSNLSGGRGALPELEEVADGPYREGIDAPLTLEL